MLKTSDWPVNDFAVKLAVNDGYIVCMVLLRSGGEWIEVVGDGSFDLGEDYNTCRASESMQIRCLWLTAEKARGVAQVGPK